MPPRSITPCTTDPSSSQLQRPKILSPNSSIARINSHGTPSSRPATARTSIRSRRRASRHISGPRPRSGD